MMDKVTSKSEASTSLSLTLMNTDMHDRVKQLIQEDEATAAAGDTFADRADAYYHRRPRLIALLNDLYDEYISLADRYSRALSKLNHHNNNNNLVPAPATPNNSYYDMESCISDTESTLSYQFQPPFSTPKQQQHSTAPFEEQNVDRVVAELVMKSIELEFMQHEMDMVARDSSRKIELQKSLLEVLESERSVLLNETSRLGYTAEMLAEEKKAVVTENVFLKRRANQLARCVMSIQEDKRAVVLSRQIEDLQRQIHALERRNKEMFTPLVVPPEVEVQQVSVKAKKAGSWWSLIKKMSALPCGRCSKIIDSQGSVRNEDESESGINRKN